MWGLRKSSLVLMRFGEGIGWKSMKFMEISYKNLSSLSLSVCFCCFCWGSCAYFFCFCYYKWLKTPKKQTGEGSKWWLSFTVCIYTHPLHSDLSDLESSPKVSPGINVMTGKISGFQASTQKRQRGKVTNIITNWGLTVFFFQKVRHVVFHIKTFHQ